MTPTSADTVAGCSSGCTNGSSGITRRRRNRYVTTYNASFGGGGGGGNITASTAANATVAHLSTTTTTSTSSARTTTAASYPAPDASIVKRLRQSAAAHRASVKGTTAGTGATATAAATTTTWRSETSERFAPMPAEANPVADARLGRAAVMAMGKGPSISCGRVVQGKVAAVAAP
jgi:hypothetical protein